MLERWRRTADLYEALRLLASKERHSPLAFRHIGLWRKGFLSDRYELYGLATNDSSLYVSDWARIVHAGTINDARFAVVLANKYVFHELLSHAFGHYLPEFFGAVFAGQFAPRSGPHGHEHDRTILELAETAPGIVVKPVEGGGGNNIHIISPQGGQLVHNGRPTDARRLAALFGSLDGYVVTGFLQQHSYSAAIFPEATNTIRVAMLRDPANGEVFVPIAVHRFGNSRSSPVDNFTQGGVAARVDIATGALSAGLSFRGRLETHEVHPETRAQVAGVVVPHWNQVLELVIRLGKAFPFLRHVGWDVVVTADGPRLIEGNHYMNPDVLQLHQPLLEDPRVRAFYRHYGVTGRRNHGRRAAAR